MEQVLRNSPRCAGVVAFVGQERFDALAKLSAVHVARGASTVSMAGKAPKVDPEA